MDFNLPEPGNYKIEITYVFQEQTPTGQINQKITKPLDTADIIGSQISTANKIGDSGKRRTLEYIHTSGENVRSTTYPVGECTYELLIKQKVGIFETGKDYVSGPFKDSMTIKPTIIPLDALCDKYRDISELKTPSEIYVQVAKQQID